MTTHRYFYIVLLLLLAVQLTSCERLASTAPGEVIPEEVIIPTPTSNPAQILIAQTQTAIALKRPTKTPITAKPDATVAPVGDMTGTEFAPNIIVTITPTPLATDAPTQVVIPTLTRPVTYTLQANEDPYCIARRYNLDIGELLSQNNLTTDSKLATGAVLKIPATNHRWSSGARVLMQHPTSYTVRSGDTLYQIACAYGDVSPEAIIVVNNLTEPYTLSAGQVLNIP